MKNGKLSIKKILMNTSIIGIFIIAGIATLSVTGTLRIGVLGWELLCILGIICATSLACIPWAEKLERKEWKRTSIVFLSIIAASALLWIIDVFVIFSLIWAIKADKDPANAIFAINFIRISLIITLQVVTASLVGTTIVKYRKNLIIFQCIMYSSVIVLDIWLTLLLSGISLNTKGIYINKSIMHLLINRTSLVILLITLVYTGISIGIVRSIETRKIKKAAFSSKRDFDILGDDDSDHVEEKLSKLKEMYDKNLITEQEYEAKKKDIIDKL